MVASSSRTTTVSRTSSSSSIDFNANAFNAADQRRTRKRISAAQLAHLEDLYRQSSHPTRDQRDSLAKRIQMETKSVTIWFQNKRQTDRKVALHNATNSRNVVASDATSSDTPDITLTTPTSPPYPPGASVSQGAGSRISSDGSARRQSIARSNALKRAPSQASSIASTSSTNSTSKSRPSLDRVASRSEIRFTEKPSLSRSTSNIAVIRTGNGSVNFTRLGSNNAPVPSSKSSILAQTNSSASLTPASPPPSTTHPLWATMLSSPLTPSSPPPADFVAYTRARKTRTLDWACAAARLAEGDAPSKLELSIANFGATSTLGSAFPFSQSEAAAREREYEEATAITEDEAELITPHGSQDIPMSWECDHSDANVNDMSSRILRITRAFDMTESMHDMGFVHPMHQTDKTDAMAVDADGWEEDEMHAALALCGLRG